MVVTSEAITRSFCKCEPLLNDWQTGPRQIDRKMVAKEIGSIRLGHGVNKCMAFSEYNLVSASPKSRSSLCSEYA